MTTLTYPSRNFLRLADALLERREQFSIVVSSTSSKWKPLIRDLEALVYQRPPRSLVLTTVADKFRLMDIYFAVANATQGHKYSIECVHGDGDITLVLTPPGAEPSGCEAGS